MLSLGSLSFLDTQKGRWRSHSQCAVQGSVEQWQSSKFTLQCAQCEVLSLWLWVSNWHSLGLKYFVLSILEHHPQPIGWWDLNSLFLPSVPGTYAVQFCCDRLPHHKAKRPAYHRLKPPSTKTNLSSWQQETLTQHRSAGLQSCILKNLPPTLQGWGMGLPASLTCCTVSLSQRSKAVFHHCRLAFLSLLRRATWSEWGQPEEGMAGQVKLSLFLAKQFLYLVRSKCGTQDKALGVTWDEAAGERQPLALCDVSQSSSRLKIICAL